MKKPAYLLFKLSFILLAVLLLASCDAHKNLIYIQDITVDKATKIPDYPEIIIQPQDMISIVVSSSVPELAQPFNLPVVTYQAGAEMSMYSGASQRLLGYVVDIDGNIDFPVLGKLKVAGLTRKQLSQLVKEKIVSENYINDPVVTVQFMNLKVYVVGEVTRPGTYDFNGDHITFLEALSMAGDLTVYGTRENVKVIREKNGKRIVYEMDLRSPEIFNSPAYYLQQNDIIYVEPNKYKARQSVNTNQFTQASLWISLASLLTTIIVLFSK